MYIFLLLVEFVIVFIAAAITYLALSGHRRTGSNSLLLVGVGFAMLGLATVIAGFLIEFEIMDIMEIHTVESTVIAASLATILMSVYAVRK